MYEHLTRQYANGYLLTVRSEWRLRCANLPARLLSADIGGSKTSSNPYTAPLVFNESVVRLCCTRAQRQQRAGKYPSVATYQNSLRDIEVQRQILHRGNDIAVYITLGKAVEVHGVFGVS
ncbi:hypothetical protein MRX96_045651 [Rhipicephalus microplus]